jgi:dTDP-glucose pyrophosphorylase
MRVIIPMAGLGSRFTNKGYKTHKPLIEVNGKTLIRYAVESLNISAHYVFVCRDLGGSYLENLESEIKDITYGRYEIKVIDHMTSGAAETALLGCDSEYDGELIVTNCDQYLDWDSEAFLKESRKYDGSVLTYDSTDPKNSFVEFANKKVVRMVEKQAISNNALVGVHYWKKASDFINSTKSSLANFTSKESYVSETYNYLIADGKKIGAISIMDGTYWSTGTPEDLAYFKGMISEYYTSKNNTYFIDLDGTIFMHAHRYSNLKNDVQLCPGVLETLDELDSRGDTIILVSARKESARSMTEKLLDDFMIPYDQLILGVSQGCRIVINDIITKSSFPRARAVNVITDKGWKANDL